MWSLQVDGKQQVVARATHERIAADEFAELEVVGFETADGTKVWGNYYAPPKTADGLPPAIILIHGGPTAHRTAAFDAKCQFFATRGFAVYDINYRGSTGFGRAFMQSLYGQWGIADVEDSVAAAKFLVDTKRAAAGQVVIMGGSAGGYTVLQALTDHPGTFKAGICLYGIANLFSLTSGTHKFESHYNDQLLGVLPEATQLFRERSPIFKAENISDKVAIYHGAKDDVVPPESGRRDRREFEVTWRSALFSHVRKRGAWMATPGKHQPLL